MMTMTDRERETDLRTERVKSLKHKIMIEKLKTGHHEQKEETGGGCESTGTGQWNEWEAAKKVDDEEKMKNTWMFNDSSLES